MVNALPYYDTSNGTDLNSYTTTGVYTIDNASNSPSGTWGTLFVDAGAGTPYQIWIPDGQTFSIYKRSISCGTFGGWSSTQEIYVSSSTPTDVNAKIWVQI